MDTGPLESERSSWTTWRVRCADHCVVSIRKRTDGEGKAALLAMLASRLATVLAAGLLTQVAGARAGFLLGAAYSLVFVLVSLPLPKVGSRSGGTAPAGSFRVAPRLLRMPGVQTALFLTFTRLWIASAFSAFMPLILVANGIPPVLAATIIAAKGAVTTVSSLTAGWLSRRLGVVRLGVLSLAAGGLGLGPRRPSARRSSAG